MSAPIPAARGLFANRTLNLRGIKAIGYDLDYTLVHYDVARWERHAYGYIRDGLAQRGFPVDGLDFDPDLVTRGLIIDTEQGNLVKATRFGFVRAASHGTTMLGWEDIRGVYGNTVIDLRDRRWRFLNTFFSISEGCMYAQLIDAFDAGKLTGVHGYDDLYQQVRTTLDEAHMEGQLKQEILDDPASYIDVDPATAQALLDQKSAGKKLVLITNSEYAYAVPILDFAITPYLPQDMTWRELFDLSIVGSRKPAFFSQQAPAFEVVDDSGLLREHQGSLEEGKVYVGGHAGMVEEALGVGGKDVCYVGDHIFTDVNVVKSLYRWRTVLVLRELEDELAALTEFSDKQQQLGAMMAEKDGLEHELSEARLLAQRISWGHEAGTTDDIARADARKAELREALVALDARISPLAREASQLVSSRWGLPMRAGVDKSHLARQVERYADAYTSRVSNFLYHTPFIYLRAPRMALPHDAEVGIDAVIK